MMLRYVVGLLAVASLSFAQRVMVISLDGLGYQMLTQGAAAREMPALRRLMARGVHMPMQPAFPSTTANGHAALATGAWGDVNGIHSNNQPVSPRAAHSSFERGVGYRAEGLRAEPVWVTAARQGMRAAAVNFVPTYPFLPSNAPAGLPLTLVNNYQTRRVAPNRLLTEADVRAVSCGEQRAMSRRRQRCFAWREGELAFKMSVGASEGAKYDYADVAIAGGGRGVRVWAAPVESEPPFGRTLARHFSEGLAVARPVGAVVYFRLFHLSEDGTSFALFRSAVEALAVSGENGAALGASILREVGGVVGNHGSNLRDRTDAVSLGRMVEIAELAIRQQGRVQEWAWKHLGARLQMGYFSDPDEAEHDWMGAAERDPRSTAALERVFMAIDRALEPLLAAVGERDHVLVVSDHGMEVARKQVRIYNVLAKAGLVARDSSLDLDKGTTKLSYLYNCLLVNTQDWKGGIVQLSDRAAVVEQARRALAEVRDPETGGAVFQAFYRPEQHNARFGIGGEAGADLCFDPAPGYYVSAAWEEPAVEAYVTPRGQHGAFPLREEMRSILIGAGPRLRGAETWPQMRAIDLAPLIADLLGITPAATVRGRSPLPAR